MPEQERETGLVDVQGKPIRRKGLKQEVAFPTMTGVRSVISDHPEIGLTPERLAQILLAAEQGDAMAQLELAESMEEKDLHYAAVIGVRKRAVSGMELTVEAASDKPADERAAELVRQALDRGGVQDELFDLLDAIAKGFAVSEIVWSTTDGVWLPEQLLWRDPRWFRFDDDGQTLLLRDGGGDRPLPPWKFVRHFARAKSGFPVRAGLARLCAWMYLFKVFDLKDWIIFAEVYGHPIRKGSYGPDATEEDVRTLLRALSAIGTDLAAAVPASMQMELIQARTQGTVEIYKELASYIDQQYSKAILGQTGTTDAIAGGHAVGRVHDDVRDDICQADARQLEGTLDRDLVRPVVDLNIGPQRAYPRIRLVATRDIPLDQFVSALVKLVPMGLRVSEADVRERLALAEPGETALLLTPPARRAVPAIAPPESTAAKDRTQTAAEFRPAQISDPEMLDRFVDELVGRSHLKPATDPLMQPIAEAIEGAASVDDLAARLDDLDLDRSALVDLLARAGFAARLAGRLGIDAGGN